MRAIRLFDEFVRNEIVKKQSPDYSRAEFLVRESEQNYLFLQELLEKFEINEKNANNFIKSCYDILMELVRAKMLLDGYNASGQGAHEAEVSYLRILGFNEAEIQFADQLRYFRNGMLYYGSLLDGEYALKVIEFIQQVYPRLRALTEEVK